MSLGIASEIARDGETNLRIDLESLYGQVWNTEELTTDFSVEGFGGGIVVVIRKSDNKKGSLEFNHRPRFYYQFKEYTP
jgi:hypothetical protein